MGSLKEVRNRIVSVKSTQQITKAMKMVSAAKLRRAQSRIMQMRPYAKKLKELLANLSSSVEGSEAAAYFQERPQNKVLLVVITSDRGLAGSFNSSAIKEALRAATSKYEKTKPENIDIVAIGKKSQNFFKKGRYKMIAENTSIFSNLTYENTEQIANMLINAFLNHEYDAIDVIYNSFKNAAVYIPTLERFLPVAPPQMEQKSKEETDKKQHHYVADYIFEPGQEEIVKRLIPQSLKVNLFRALLESNAAEHGARMTAMDKATDNAEDLINQLKLKYNKERQATITKEILEIVGGAAALGG